MYVGRIELSKNTNYNRARISLTITRPGPLFVTELKIKNRPSDGPTTAISNF